MLRRMRKALTASVCGPIITIAVPAVVFAQSPSGLIRPGQRAPVAPVQTPIPTLPVLSQAAITGRSYPANMTVPVQKLRRSKSVRARWSEMIRPASAVKRAPSVPDVDVHGAPDQPVHSYPAGSPQGPHSNGPSSATEFAGQHYETIPGTQIPGDFTERVVPGSVHEIYAPGDSTNSLSTPAFGNGLITPQSVFANDVRKMELITPYMSRVQMQSQLESAQQEEKSADELPGDYAPWWKKSVQSQMRAAVTPIPVSLEQLTMSALQNSPQVQSLTVEPAIRQHTVIVEDAAFDWTAFVDSTWDDLSEPVGNTLTTGGSPRFRDHKLSVNGGFRRRTRAGGELELSQQLGYQDNNSNFFVPSQQGQTRLAMNFTQPLMRESGVVYNQSRIILAQLDSDATSQRVMTDLQDHLKQVSDVYWELYRSRAVNLQKLRLLEKAESILETLKARQNVDVLQRQVLRASAAVSTRKSEITRTRAAIRNAEARLRYLVNDPRLTAGPFEILPADEPMQDKLKVTLAESMEIALQNRPDITEAIKTLRSTSVRLGVAKRDLMPKLDLVLGAYLSGLEDGSDINLAWGNQFTEGEPSYSIGLQFEIPLGNRAAKVRQEQRELQMFKAMQDFKATVEKALTEVEIAVREANTSHQEMTSRYQSMLASNQEAVYLEDRWRSLPGSDKSTGFLLEGLLDSQERGTLEESEFVKAQVGYMQAMVELKRATGMLMQQIDGIDRQSNRLLQEEQQRYLREHQEVQSQLPQSFQEMAPVPMQEGIPAHTEAIDATDIEPPTDGLIRVPRSRQ